MTDEEPGHEGAQPIDQEGLRVPLDPAQDAEEQDHSDEPEPIPDLTQATPERESPSADTSERPRWESSRSGVTASQPSTRERRSRTERNSGRLFDRDRGRDNRGQGAGESKTATPGSSESGEQRAEAGARGREFPDFRIITERNIFNASRASRANRPPPETRRPTRTESLTLVGTLTYDKGPYAFFDGSSSDFKKVLEPGKSIVGYRIAEITADAVQLEQGTNKIELRVGMQMRQEEDGWRVVDSGLTQTASASDSSASTDSSAEESDIIKRMMQQREQELNK